MIDRFAKLTEVAHDLDYKPLFVKVFYKQKDGKEFADLLMVQGKKIHEGWDFTEGKAADESMSIAHPDFKFQGFNLAQFVRATYEHPNHPNITEIRVVMPHATHTMYF